MSACRNCGKEIEWVQVEGKWKPYNFDDGKWHFETCHPDMKYMIKEAKKKNKQEKLLKVSRYEPPEEEGGGYYSDDLPF